MPKNPKEDKPVISQPSQPASVAPRAKTSANELEDLLRLATDTESKIQSDNSEFERSVNDSKLEFSSKTKQLAEAVKSINDSMKITKGWTQNNFYSFRAFRGSIV